MVYRKLPTAILFLLSFFLIAISGYQCSTRVMESGRGEIAINPANQRGVVAKPSESDYYYPEDYFKNKGPVSNRLPQPVNDRCSRGQLRDLSKRYGAMANFEFDTAGLQDFLFGQSQNFDLECARLYINMNRTAYNSSPVYKGSLAMAYQTATNIKTAYGFNSGYSSSDNRYNQWSAGSWREDKNKQVNKNFHAIFEDEHSALILKLENIIVRDIGDGEIAYLGAGEIYYKMFRIATINDVRNTRGSCYSQGSYVSQAHTQPTARNGRCWFIKFGPYSCRPEGSLDPKDKHTNIDITANSYKCFSRLGRFWNLDIEETFNDSVEDID